MTDNPAPQAPQDSVMVKVALLERALKLLGGEYGPLRAELAAYLPQPDPARELLARALDAQGHSSGSSPSWKHYAEHIRQGGWNAAVEVIREGMKPRMTPEIAAALRMLRPEHFCSEAEYADAHATLAAAFQDDET